MCVDASSTCQYIVGLYIRIVDKPCLVQYLHMTCKIVQIGKAQRHVAVYTGVANLMLDLLAQLQLGGVDRQEAGGPSSLLLLGPPGVGQLPSS